MEKIALLPGGFKPPHAGHYNMAKWLATNTDADTIIVKIGAKERDGITRDMSLKLWDLYRSSDSDPASNKLTIIPSKHNSPVKDVYDFIENDAPEGSTIYLAMGEKELKTNDQRFANIHKVSEPKNINFETKLVPPQAGGVSGTDMRDFIKSKDQYSFFEFMPDHLNSEQKEQAWQIVTTVETSDWKPGDPVSFEMWTSDWNLKGFGKEYDSNFKNREDAVAHYKPNKAEDWAFKSYAYVAKKIPGFGGDLDEDLYNPEDKVLDYMRGSEWKAGMPDGPKDDIPRAYKYKRGGMYNAATGQGGAGTMYENLSLEIMNTPELQVQGMMGRDNLEGGMLFPYEEVGERSFHMKNCLIPLDIVFIAQDKITNIHHNCPPCLEDNCPQYTGTADNVLELPGGHCQQNNINVGDHINFNPSDVSNVNAASKTLTAEEQLLNELEDYEIKFFAMHADILKQLNTPNFKAKFVELQQELEGDRLEALEYFWDEFFSNLEDSCEIEKSFDKKVNETEYAAHDSLTQHKDKIQSDYGHQQYRDLQLMISQQKDKEVKNWLKTKDYMNEISVFSKDWWFNMLTEGGAAGHMAHPFDLPNVKTGKDLKDIFEKAVTSLNTNPGAVKIDGVNSSIRLITLDGVKQFVMDRGSKKELDIKGITKDDLLSRFGAGHGMIKVGGEVLDMFNTALPEIEYDLKNLGAWDDPNILFNMEYVSGKTNVQDYESNFVAIHGLNRIENKEVQGKRKMLTKRISKEISYNKNTLQSLLDNLAPIAKKQGFEVYGSVPTKMKKKPNFNSALSQNYSVEFTEEVKTQPLSKWLDEVIAIPKDEFIFITRDNTSKKVGAVSKQVYQLILNGENVDDLFDENDRKRAIDGFITYLATEKLGDEILKALDSPMGSVENHEGVVIRDEKIASVPFKITGKFILGGLISDF